MNPWNNKDLVQMISESPEEKEFFLLNDGIRLHAKFTYPGEEKETFPVVILIHGFTGHMEERHILAVMDTFLSCGIGVLRVEMYGHGMSEGQFKDHTLFKWLNGALAAVDFAESLPFVSDLYLAGHSQGGLTVILLAAMERDRVKAVLPLSPALCIPVDARKGEVLGLKFDPEHIPDVLKYEDRYDEKSLGGNYVRVAQTIRAEDAIDGFDGPVLIVHGDADAEVDVQYSIEAAKRYKNCRLVLVSGDTHCYDNHLDKVTAAVRDFLNDVLKGQDAGASL